MDGERARRHGVDPEDPPARLSAADPPGLVRYLSVLWMRMAETPPPTDPADPSGFLSPDRFDRMLSALHDLGWRPVPSDVEPGYLRWCEWPDCLRSYNVLDGPSPERDGRGWEHATGGTRALLCPEHAVAGHRPGSFDWRRDESVIGMSCGCGESVAGLSPTTIDRCMAWWRDHVRSTRPRGRRGVYVRVRPDTEVATSRCDGVATTVDYGPDGRVVGVGVLGAVAVEIDGKAAW